MEVRQKIIFKTYKNINSKIIIIKKLNIGFSCGCCYGSVAGLARLARTKS
jgi:hypothetical protein